MQPAVTAFYYAPNFSLSFQNNPHTLTATRITDEKSAFQMCKPTNIKFSPCPLRLQRPSPNTPTVQGTLRDMSALSVA